MTKPKLHWERPRRKPFTIWEKEKIHSRPPEKVFNEAIHKLIIIKKRRIEDGATPKSIRRVQKAIDEMMKEREKWRKADKFAIWRLKNM